MPNRSYSFKEGLAMMAANDVGIDPYLAAEAGEDARSILAALRRAKIAKGPEKSKHIAAAQTELRKLNPKQHGKLINALQAKVLALQGRGGDTAVAHLEPGEMVVPRRVLTPELMQLIAVEAAKRGIDPKQLIVGSRKASINPATGTEEFGLFSREDEEELEIEPITVRATRRSEPLLPVQWQAAVDEAARTSAVDRLLPSLNAYRAGDSLADSDTRQQMAPYERAQRNPSQPNAIQGSIKKISETLEPLEVGATLLQYNKKMAPIIKPAGKLLGPAGIVTNLIEEATADKSAPKPNYSFEEGDDWARKIYKGTLLGEDVFGPMATAAGLTSLVAPEIMGPIAIGAGLGYAGSWLGNGAVSKYCQWNGRRADCS